MVFKGLKSFYGRDKSREEAMARFLDMYYYNKHDAKLIERVEDPRMQKAGVDTVVSIGPGIFNVDEKAATSYLTRPIDTFALELSTVSKDGKRVDGWLIREGSRTDYYLFLWPRVFGYWKEGDPFSEDDIEYVEYALVHKPTLMRYLDLNGYSVEELKDKVSDILDGMFDISSQDRDTYPRFTYSTKLAEAPVNVLLEKKTYFRLAVDSGVIRPDGR